MLARTMPQPTGPRCLGIHIEGPFLNPKFRRVHRGEWLLDATVARAKALIEASRGTLVLATMAPEVEGVGEVARFFYDQGIVCAAGHTAAKYRDGMLANGLGFRTLTHAFSRIAPPWSRRSIDAWPRSSRMAARTVQVVPTDVASLQGDDRPSSCTGLLGRATRPSAMDYMAPTGGKYRIEGGVVRASRFRGFPSPAALMNSMLSAQPDVMCASVWIPRRRVQSACAAPARLLGI